MPPSPFISLRSWRDIRRIRLIGPLTHCGDLQYHACLNRSNLLARHFSSISNSPPFKNFIESPKENNAVSDTSSTWESSTLKLIEKVPVGSMKTREWQEAKRNLLYWTSLRTFEGVSWGWRILDRLVDEKKHAAMQHSDKTGSAPELSNAWLHAILDSWRCCPKGRPGDDTMDPYQIMTKVDGYAPYLMPHIRIYEMLITSCKIRDNPREAPQLAESILERLWNDSKVHAKLRPNSTLYKSVLNAWAHSGHPDAPSRIEAHLKQMQDYQEKGWMDLAPNHDCYVAAILAWANIGEARRAEEWLERMNDSSSNVHPTADAFSLVLVAWMRSKEAVAPERAEQLLSRMQELHEQGWVVVKPSVKAFNVVLNCWAKSTQPNAADRAESLFQRMQELNNGDVIPDEITCNTVLDAWSRSQRKDAPERAEALLQQMKEGRWRGVKAGMISFNVVLSCWAKSTRLDAPERAEALLQQMQELHNSGNTTLKPDVISCSTVLDAWSRSRREDAPERVEALVQNMYDGGWMGVKPGVRSFNAILNCWANLIQHGARDHGEVIFPQVQELNDAGDKEVKRNVHSQRRNAPERAESLLERMCNGEWAGIKPTVSSFNIVFNCWAKSTHPSAAERAEALLQRMQELNHAGHIDVKPNEISCNSVLDAWSRSQRKDAPEQAEALLQKMRAGEWAGIKPNSTSFNVVLICWANSTGIGAAEHAESLLQQMQALYKAGNKNVKPNLTSCNAVLRGWSRSPRDDAPARAELLLRQMYNGEWVGVQPNLASFHRLLVCWTKSLQHDAAEHADACLRGMQAMNIAGYRGAIPNVVSCNIVLGAWYRSQNEDAPARAEVLLQQMCEGEWVGVKPDLQSFATVINCLAKSKDPDAANRADAIRQQMQRCAHQNNRSVPRGLCFV